jgi:signal peptidase II
VIPRRYFCASAATLSVIVLDQASKAWLRHVVPHEGGLQTLLPGCLQLTHRLNPGIAFSLFHGQAWAPVVFSIVAVVAVVGIAWMLWRCAALPGFVAMALGLIAGGALGNLCDRLHPPYMVLDFIDCYLGAYHWPAFNLADSAICLGVGVLLLANFTHPEALLGAPPAD